MINTLLLSGILACTDGGVDSPSTTSTTDTPTTDTVDTADTGETGDTGPAQDPICAEFGVADTSITPGEGSSGADNAVLVADGVPVFLDVTTEALTLFTLDTNGITDIALFYTERALGDVSPPDSKRPVEATCRANDEPCDNMSTMRLYLSAAKYHVEAKPWPVPIWVVAMDAADAPTCSE